MRWLIIALLVSWLNVGAADEIPRIPATRRLPLSFVPDQSVLNDRNAVEAVDEIPDWKNYQAQNATRNAFDSIIKKYQGESSN